MKTTRLAAYLLPLCFGVACHTEHPPHPVPEPTGGVSQTLPAYAGEDHSHTAPYEKERFDPEEAAAYVEQELERLTQRAKRAEKGLWLSIQQYGKNEMREPELIELEAIDYTGISNHCQGYSATIAEQPINIRDAPQFISTIYNSDITSTPYVFEETTTFSCGENVIYATTDTFNQEAVKGDMKIIGTHPRNLGALCGPDSFFGKLEYSDTVRREATVTSPAGSLTVSGEWKVINSKCKPQKQSGK